MQTNKYRKLIGLVLIVLLATVMVSMYFLLQTGPRVRYLEVGTGVKNHSINQNSNIALRFDRPIQQKDYSDSITIEPQIGFTTKTYDQSIVITLLENTQFNTEYSLSLSPDIIDSTGRNMKRLYETTFTGGTPEIVYIQRNYGFVAETQNDQDDKVITTDFSGREEVLFTHPEIRSIGATLTHIVVVAKNDTHDDMYLIERSTRKVQQVAIPNKSFITNLSVAPRGNTAVFSMQPDYNSVTKMYNDQFANLLTVVNIPSGSIDYITDGNDQILRAYAIRSDIDGQIIFTQDQDQQWYATSPYNDYKPILIGAYSELYSYNQKRGELVLRDGGNFYTYNLNQGERIKQNIQANGYIQSLSGQFSTIFYSSVTYMGEQSRSRLFVQEEWDKPVIRVWESDKNGQVLAGFEESPDGNYSLLQINPASCSYDQIGFNTACKEPVTKIIQFENSQNIAEFRGFDAVWLP